MPSACFLDTNILVYPALRDENDARKCDIARRIVAEEPFCLSAQVLAEFYVSAVLKPKTPISSEEADRWITSLCRFFQAGIALARRYHIYYYDGAVVAAAERLGAQILYTEDLSHGQHYGSVMVLNPFRGL